MNEVALTTQASKQLFIKMVMDAWNHSTNQVTKLFNELSDEQILAEAAPGRNTGIYLLGHLTAVTDKMLPLLGLGERLYTQLDKPFLATPDKSGLEIPSVQELKQYWSAVNAKLSAALATVTPDDWFDRHTAVSAEDFAKEPHRNKLNLLLNRTNHQSTHYGQLIYLKPKN
jgi:hypothetical protein